MFTRRILPLALLS